MSFGPEHWSGLATTPGIIPWPRLGRGSYSDHGGSFWSPAGMVFGMKPGFTPSGGIDGSTKYLSYIFSEMEPLTHLLIGLFFGAFVGVLCFVLHLLCTKYKTSTRREQKNRLTLALEDLSQCETVPKQTICAFPIQITQETEIDIGFNFRNCKTKKIP